MENFNMLGHDFNMWEEAKARALQHRGGTAASQQQNANHEVSAGISTEEDDDVDEPPHQAYNLRDSTPITKDRCSMPPTVTSV